MVDQSPLDPAPQAAPPSGPDNMGGTSVSDLANQWSDWIAKPQNRSALMQFGVAMLQPVQPGESGASHFANAVGYGGEAAASVAEQERKTKTVDDQSTLRESQANLAGAKASLAGAQASVAPELAAARAQTAAAGAEAAGSRSEVNLLRAQNDAEFKRSLRDIQISNAYQAYIRDTNKANELSDHPQPIMDKDSWMASQGLKPAVGAAQGAPMPPGQGTKPSVNSIITKNPAAWSQIKALAKSGDPRGLKALDDLRNQSSDPQSVDALMKEP